MEKDLVILTFDRDYGELLFKYQMDPPPAVVYFRTKGSTPSEAGDILLTLIQSEDLEIKGYFTVVEEEGYRQRKLF